MLGFSDGTAKLYDTYEYYRKAVRKPKVIEPVQAKVEVKKNKPSQNQAQARRERARAAERVRELERLIEEKEQEQKQLEEKFVSGDATREDYDLYACNAAVIEKMYDEYGTLC